MAHWRTMVQSEHFCAADLWDDKNEKYVNAVLKITKVEQGTVTGQKGRKKGLPFLTLEDVNGRKMRAPFGANPTNCAAISTSLGTPDARKWVGKWIGVYVTKVDSPNGLVDAIRVAPKAVQPNAKGDVPPQQPQGELTEEDKRAIELAEQEEARRAGG